MPKKKHNHQAPPSSFLPSLLTPTSYQLLSSQSPNSHDPIPSSMISQPSKYFDFYSYFVMNLKIIQLHHLLLVSFAYFLFVFFIHFFHLIFIGNLDILFVWVIFEVIDCLKMFFIRSRMLGIEGVCLRCLLMGVGGGLSGVVIGVGFGIRGNGIAGVVMFDNFLTQFQTSYKKYSDSSPFLPA